MKLLFALLLLTKVFCQDELDGEVGTKSDPLATPDDDIERMRAREYEPTFIMRAEDGSEITLDKGEVDINGCYLPLEEIANKQEAELSNCGESNTITVDASIAEDKTMCDYKCKPIPSQKCWLRYWWQYEFLVNIGGYQCKPYKNYPVLGSTCSGSCFSIASYNPFDKKKKCECCDADKFWYGYVLLECWPIETKPINKLIWYRYPVVRSCDCQPCN